MAINTFVEKATKFLAILDEIYQKQALTASLDSPSMASQFVGTNKIKLPKISVDGAANYDRDTGYVQGGVTVNYEEHELKYDRGRKFRIDVIDDDESAFDLFRRVTAEYVRTKEIPELDAIRFAEIYAAATRANTLGTVVSADLDATASALEAFDAAENVLNEKEVPEEGRVLYVSNAFYQLLKNDDKIMKRIDVNSNNGNIDRRVRMLDGVTPIIPVPGARFMSQIQLLDGTTSGQNAGGYKAIAGTTKGINFIYAAKDAITGGAVKRNVSKIITPEVNQSADAYDVFYRVHHDLIIPDNKTAALYVHTAETAAK